MGHIIPLHDRHQQTQELLPWYVTGAIDADDRQIVEAHLADCAECQAELAIERRLRSAVVAMPVQAEPGWAAFRARLEASTGQPAEAELETLPPLPIGRGSRWRAVGTALRGADRPGRSGWVMAAQAAALVLVATMVIPSFTTQPTAPYRTLSAPPVPNAEAGNMIVMFRPNTPEQDMRRTLVESGARLVGGPTEAHAYILSVPAPRRMAALAHLRAQPAIVMAEPIDAAAHP
jgi:hypothetical protein